ncbi:hypothetical protein BX600DRAFT_543715 [Xylariales sp. PMI_506]|nr:hypothetical protein BX600DRAFT_543715 [Xylariales sp. PMI_506]
MLNARFITSVILVAHLAVGNAEYINVAVGQGGSHFSHPAFPASPGDVIVFNFGNPSGFPGGNHTVTQSRDFSSPCLPKEGGFNSGFVTLTEAEYEIGGIHWLLTINDTEPIWYYCGQAGHCQSGMVGSINANLSDGSNETYLDFSSLAVQATTASVPAVTGGGRLVTGSAFATESPAASSTHSPTSRANSSSTATLPTVTASAARSTVAGRTEQGLYETLFSLSSIVSYTTLLFLFLM